MTKPEDPPRLTEEQLVEVFGDLLTELVEIGEIADFDRCPGVPCFDIELLGGQWIQIEVKP